ncbi:ABC transporter permease [Leptolyngbya sp. PCC 6406]|uniref:ABC transporter permease n=1 Tax=Leptolyngbya sp. PCC 6406 TaxID=1173264 RepID=UPI0002ABE47E|nr:iron export ABC transporter permease subunit FetB [Leptolyngbya sp. PCC 6406]
MAVIELTGLQLTLALGLMAIAIALSAWQRLGLTGSLAIATGRTVLQLLGVGYLLAVVFAWRSPWAVLGILGVMLTVAAWVARNRISKQVKGLLVLVLGTLLASTALTMAYIILVVMRPEPWYEPRYLVPLTGMVLGNTMTAAAIAGERLVNALQQNRTAIETHLSLGATPAQAIHPYRREAITAGLIPTLNAMMVVGIVTLPGIITGQLLAGADPLNAALYQMMIMFMLAFATLLAALLITLGLRRRFFNAAAQLIVP